MVPQRSHFGKRVRSADKKRGPLRSRFGSSFFSECTIDYERLNTVWYTHPGILYAPMVALILNYLLVHLRFCIRKFSF